MLSKFYIFCLIFVLSSCGSGGSSSIINPIIDQPPSNANQLVQCSNYDGPLENVIWIDDFIDTDYTTNWTSIIGNGAEYGIPGWGNNEKQYYTSSVNNVYVINPFIENKAIISIAIFKNIFNFIYKDNFIRILQKKKNMQFFFF